MAMKRRAFSRILASGGATAVLGLTGTGTGTSTGTGASAAGLPTRRPRRNVVLVHGAFADGSSWSKVIRLLQGAGVTVTSVQNPLTSLADDVAATRRTLDDQTGPTVLVGHSYGGSVIRQAGDHPLVESLVYVAARAPEAGEDYPALARRFPTPPASAGLVFKNGFGGLTEDAFLDHFANGVPRNDARVLYAAQGRIAQTLFSTKTIVAAWKSKPSKYVVATDDRTTNPDLQRFVANRMNAETTEVGTGHLPLVVQPHVVARIILDAVHTA